MKRIVIVLLLWGYVHAQTTPTPDQVDCITQPPYTKTTDPNDSSPYLFSANSFNYNLSPNANGTQTHFDWVNTQFFTVWSSPNPSGVVASAIFRSPFYCSGNSQSNGGCSNNNTAIYTTINQNSTSYPTQQSKLKAMDILPEDGWELIKYSFGSQPTTVNVTGNNEPNPSFWLYNRYTGKVKVFIAVTNINFSTGANPNSAVLKITTDPPGEYDLLANAKPFTHIFSAFNHIDDINATTNCDVISINSANPGLQYYWLYSEFIASYDPCVCRQNANTLIYLQAEVILSQTSNVQLELKGSATALGYNASGAGTTLAADSESGSNYSADLSPVNNLINGGKAVMKGYTEWEGYADKFKKFFNQVTVNGTTPPVNDPQVTKIIEEYAVSVGQSGASAASKTQIFYNNLNGVSSAQNPTPDGASKFIQKLAGLSPLVEDLASAAPYIGAFISLVNFLSDAGTNESQNAAQPAAPPTSYALDATIRGTISLSSPGPKTKVVIPGSHINTNKEIAGQTNADHLFPIYNNPLGVFNIVDVPQFMFKDIPTTNLGDNPNDFNHNYSFYNFTSLNGSPFVFCHLNCCSALPNQTKPFDVVRDYKLSGPIKYALNPTSNLSVKSIDACFVIQYDGDNSLQILNDTKVDLGRSNSTSCVFNISPNTRVNKQIPYFPTMTTEFNPQSNVYPMFTGDNINTVMNKLENVGFEIESKSSSYSDALGNNSNGEKFSVRTKYVPIQSLHEINFILLGSQNVVPNIYLKLFCKFSKKNNPNAEPVTMILTYDIKGKLMSAIPDPTGNSGGSGNFFQYYVNDIAGINSGNVPPQPADYGHFGGLNLQGAYANPYYSSNTSPQVITTNVSGAIASANITVANNLALTQNGGSNGVQTYVTTNDFTFGDNASIINNGSTNPLINNTTKVQAGNNIIAGKDFFIGTTNNGKMVFTAANDIKIDEGYVISASNAIKTNLYAGRDIKLNYLNGNASSGSPISRISNAGLYAQNEIEVKVTSPLHDADIENESILSIKNKVPNAYAILHGADGNLQLNDLVASNSEIANFCGGMGNRPTLSAQPTDSNLVIPTRDPVEINLPVNEIASVSKSSQVTDLNDKIKLGIFPNPTSEVLYVNLFTPLPMNITISLEELSGRILLQENRNNLQGFTNNVLNLNDFANGMYLIRISDDKGTLMKTERVFLQR